MDYTGQGSERIRAWRAGELYVGWTEGRFGTKVVSKWAFSYRSILIVDGM